MTDGFYFHGLTQVDKDFSEKSYSVNIANQLPLRGVNGIPEIRFLSDAVCDRLPELLRSDRIMTKKFTARYVRNQR